MNSEFIVERIGLGVEDALKTKARFLGIEKFEFRNPDIRPEYLTTVKVAERLASSDYEVELEASMNKVRHLAEAIVRLRSSGGESGQQRRRELLEQLRVCEFGKRRLDIIVHSNQDFTPPVLVAEAKLGVGNRKGIVRDIDRVFRLINMFHEVEALEKHSMYGAVLFHSMVDGGVSSDLRKKSSSLLCEVNVHLSKLHRKHSWLFCKAGLLSSFLRTEEQKGKEEIYEDGSREIVHAKDGFTFAAGLVLLGNAQDICTVKF